MYCFPSSLLLKRRYDILKRHNDRLQDSVDQISNDDPLGVLQWQKINIFSASIFLSVPVVRARTLHSEWLSSNRETIFVGLNFSGQV